MIVYKCDICKKIYENENMTKIQLPMNEYWYATNNGVKLAKIKHGIRLSDIEICPSCASRIANYLDSLGITC